MRDIRRYARVYLGKSEKASPRNHWLEWRVKNRVKKEWKAHIEITVNQCETPFRELYEASCLVVA